MSQRILQANFYREFFGLISLGYSRPNFMSKIVSIPLQFHMFEPNIFHSNPLLAGETKRLHVWSHLTEVPNHVTLPCKSFLNPQEAIKKRGTSQSGHLNIRSEKLQNESSPNFSNFRPEFCPECCSEFSPNFSCFVSWGTETRKKFTKNPRHFSMRNSQANTLQLFTKCFWRAGKVTEYGISHGIFFFFSLETSIAVCTTKIGFSSWSM